MFNVDLKGPELSVRAAVAAAHITALEWREGGGSVRGEAGGAGLVFTVLSPHSHAWGPPSAPHPQVKASCAGGRS